MPNVMQQLFVMNIESLLKEYAAYRAFNKSDCVINMRIPHQIVDKIKELADNPPANKSEIDDFIHDMLHLRLNKFIGKRTTETYILNLLY